MNTKRKADKLNIATIVLIVTTLVTVLWTFSKVDSRGVANAKWIAENKSLPVVVAKIEEKLDSFGKRFDRFLDKMDRFMESR